jgi:hypothetical protein
MEKKESLSKKTRGTISMAYASFFSHPDFTVGQGISPCREQNTLLLFADYTAGMDFHHSPKNFSF